MHTTLESSTTFSSRNFLHSKTEANSPFVVNIKSLRKRNKANALLAHPLYITFLFFFTAYALFADDLRQLCFPKWFDSVFYVFTLIAFSFFVLDIVLLSCFKKNYFFSLLFFCDVISTGSLLLDVGWIKVYQVKR